MSLLFGTAVALVAVETEPITISSFTGPRLAGRLDNKNTRQKPLLNHGKELSARVFYAHGVLSSVERAGAARPRPPANEARNPRHPSFGRKISKHDFG